MRVLASSQLAAQNGQVPDASLFLDACLGQWGHEASNLSNLSAMTTGAFAFSSFRFFANSSLTFLPSMLGSALSNAFALFTEVAVFRGVNEMLSDQGAESFTNSQGFLRDYLNFASLKGCGFFLQSSNPLLRHFSQNLGMMAAEECTTHFGFTPENDAGFIQRFVQASVTNLALECGGHFAGVLTAGRLHRLESQFHRELVRENATNSPSRELSRRALEVFSEEGGVSHPRDPEKARELERLFFKYAAAQPSYERLKILSSINEMGRDFFKDLKMSPEHVELILGEVLLQSKASICAQQGLWGAAYSFIEHYMANPHNSMPGYLEVKIMKFLGTCQFFASAKKVKIVRDFFDRKLQGADFKVGSHRFWQILGPQLIHFTDGESVLSNIPHFLMENYKRIPPQEKIEVRPTSPSLAKRISRSDCLAAHSLDESHYVTQHHRSVVYRMGEGGKILVFKNTRLPGDFYENDVQDAITKAGIEGLLPEAAQRKSVRILVGTRDEVSQVAYYADPRYFDYLDDVNLSEEDFIGGISRSARAVGILARRGLYQTEPLALYHHRVNTAGRRYVVCPEFLNPYTMTGMGVIDNYSHSLKYPNYSVPGMRDAESIESIDRVLNGERNTFREIYKRSKTQAQGEARIEATLVGDNLLALTLLIGHRMAHEANQFNNPEEMILGAENAWLHNYAGLFLQTFSEFYAARRKMTLDQAASILRDRADWLRLARQCVFYMTRSYQEYVYSDFYRGDPHTRYSREEAFRTLYGNSVEIVGMGPYKDESTQREIPYWPESDIGPANGAFTITEFERAWCATLFGKNLEEMQD